MTSLMMTRLRGGEGSNYYHDSLRDAAGRYHSDTNNLSSVSFSSDSPHPPLFQAYSLPFLRYIALRPVPNYESISSVYLSLPVTHHICIRIHTSIASSRYLDGGSYSSGSFLGGSLSHSTVLIRTAPVTDQRSVALVSNHWISLTRSRRIDCVCC
jgi:hypothetical protein